MFSHEAPTDRIRFLRCFYRKWLFLKCFPNTESLNDGDGGDGGDVGEEDDDVGEEDDDVCEEDDDGDAHRTVSMMSNTVIRVSDVPDAASDELFDLTQT